jgi:hypothetical protein
MYHTDHTTSYIIMLLVLMHSTYMSLKLKGPFLAQGFTDYYIIYSIILIIYYIIHSMYSTLGSNKGIWKVELNIPVLQYYRISIAF